jgi:hypothetical protein
MVAMNRVSLFKNGVKANFNDIDAEICNFMGVLINPENWAFGWYDSICGRLAYGRTFEEIKANFEGEIEYARALPPSMRDSKIRFYENLIKILLFLKDNYTHDAWYSPN